MPQNVMWMDQGQVAFSAGGQESLTLDRSQVYREIALRLRMQPTVTAGNNTAAKTNLGDAWAMVSKLELVANGGDVLRSFKGYDLPVLMYYLYGQGPETQATLGDGSTANPSLDQTVILPLWLPRSIRPLDTALDSRVLSDLEIRVTWASDASAVSDDASGFESNPSLEVFTLGSMNLRGNLGSLFMRRIVEKVSGASDPHRINLPIGPNYRALLIHLTDGGADNADGVTGQLKVKSSNFEHFVCDFPTMHSWQRLRYGLPAFSGYESGDYDEDAWLFLDFVTDGFLSEAIPTAGLSQFVLEVETAEATDIEIVPITYVPPRQG